MDSIALFTLKILVTTFVIILIPIYWKNYTYRNFFWLSDVGLFLTVFALWFHSSLLISIIVIGIFPLELAWNIDFFYQLLIGRNLIGIADYMFEPDRPIFLRSLSLFHVVFPIIWIGCLLLWGYDEQAFIFAVGLIWIVFIMSYIFTKPEENVNWVYLPYIYQWKWVPSLVWLCIILISVPILFIWPMHLLLSHIG